MVNFLLTGLPTWIIPVLIGVIFLHAAWKGIPVYGTFVEGAAEGFGLAVKLIPFVVGVFVAIGMLRASGAMELFSAILAPVLSLLHLPVEILPLALTRPLSGPASLGLAAELMDTHGPDSFIGRLAGVMEASTDTTLYIIALYFASVGVRKAGYALKVGLTADIVGMVAAVVFVSLLF